MVDGIHSKATASGGRGIDLNHNQHCPPPSTLAAQLVEDISPSTKSSRSDENTELKGLFTVIQKVKNDPASLKTTAERIEHNNMLIYVYCRVVLDNINLDDPFLDRALVRSEALKAVNFLRFTIKETPTVLAFGCLEKCYMFRGQEPLWIWLLPQLLRLLGHPQCLDLQGSIEGFIQYLLLVIARNSSLWEISSSFASYLRVTLNGCIESLQGADPASSFHDATLSIKLPPPIFLDNMFGDKWHRAMHGLTFTIDRASHALRYITSVAAILTSSIVSHDPAFSTIMPWSENDPWLLDTLLDLRLAQTKWRALAPTPPLALIEMVLEIVGNMDTRAESFAALKEKAYTLLILLCGDMVVTPVDLMLDETAGEAEQLVLCRALVMIAQAALQSRVIGRLAETKLVDELSLLSLQYPSVGEGTDIWRCAQLLNQAASQHVNQFLNDSALVSNFKHPKLREFTEKTGLCYDFVRAVPFHENRSKKMKISNTNEDALLVSLVQQIYHTLNIEKPENGSLSGLEAIFLDTFLAVDEPSQCAVIDILSQFCCIVDNATVTNPNPSSSAISCRICETKSKYRRISESGRNETKRLVEAIFSALVQSSQFLESRRSRIAVMIALRRLTLHSSEADFLNLEKSVPGQWCIQSLNSSLRELRIAAGRTLILFMLPSQCPDQSEEGKALFQKNRQNIIAILKSVSEKQQSHLVESFIMTWGELGKVVDDNELNLVLIQLLEYLGSSNSIISAFAFSELTKLAESLNMTPRRLLEPYWRSLAYLVTKDMIQQPQRSRAVAELLQITVTDLLLMIQIHALPWLVLDKRKDIIQKFAEARQEAEIWLVLIDGTNLGAILSLLLIQDTEDIQSFAKSRLDDISPHFHSNSLLSLIQSEPVLTAMELLKAAGDANEQHKPMARKALHAVAKLMQPKGKQAKSKKTDITGRFLEHYLLGLMARFTDVLNDSGLMVSSVMEQRQFIRALDEMIRLAKGYAGIARPQISACILCALPHISLRDAAFSCWSTMLHNLDEEDVQALLETTFFIVHRYWTTLSSTTSQIVKDMMNWLLDRYDAIMHSNINKLPSLSKINGLEEVETRLAGIRQTLTLESMIDLFSVRVTNDNSGVVHLALMELVSFLKDNLGSAHTFSITQRSDKVVAGLLRVLLDCVCKYNGIQSDISRLCVECIGIIGCLDSNRIEIVRENRSIVILDNFERTEEVTDFTLFILEEVLVPAFLSATDTKIQGFLCFAMQELLDRSEIKAACSMKGTGVMDGNEIYRKWLAIPANIREVLQPFISSKYMVAPMPSATTKYPIFQAGKSYGNWLRPFVLDLLRKGQNPHADMIFEPLSRVIRVKDLSAAEFLLPYLVLHILLGDRSDETQKNQVTKELRIILQYEPADDASYAVKEDRKRLCHAVFRVLDYAMRWIQNKRSAARLTSADKVKLSNIQNALDGVPAQLIAQRAIDCNEYARALFHLEQYAQEMETKKREPGERTDLLKQLQDIYANIDEPDGLEGISSHLPALDMNQQILSHKKAGRWTAAQTWYEIELAKKPNNVDVQLDLLNCLKQAGQHDVLLNHIEGMQMNVPSDNRIIPFAVEAAWVTSRWESLDNFTSRFQGNPMQDFNISVATLLDSLRKRESPENLSSMIQEIREHIASSMNSSATASLQAAHDQLLRCHVLTDLEIIIGFDGKTDEDKGKTMALLENRLEVIGAYFNDKQYLLGIRRAAMELMRPKFTNSDIAGLWLCSARLARRTNLLNQSFNAVLHASQLGDDAATLENAKLMWRDSHHRKAIQMLQGAIENNKFMTQTMSVVATSGTAGANKLNSQQKLLSARAQLLLAKWLDAAGQTHATALREKYQQPPRTYSTWEKGHYYLGRHYKKILESEKPLKVDDQSDNYVTGEIARLVIENYVRSLNSGTKYLYQTLPRILTLWLDMGAKVDKPPEGKASLSRELHKRRLEQLNLLHSFLDKYIHRLPAYIFYTALPQIVARIAHPNQNVFERLTHIIVKVVDAHPRQALWSLIGIITTKQVTERKARGTQILQMLRNASKKVEGASYDLKTLIRMGERLAEQLLLACQNGDFPGNKTARASLTRDLRFNHKCTPCPLAVPVEGSLTATLPAVSEQVKTHKAFSPDVVSFDCFLDEVLVLSSLAKPRRLTARGSDGNLYMLLIKPKDDLRTDQRLMEFNGMINRSLKRDAESTRRQLYIRTYAVVPLNEECGIIEWVPGIKTMRDILLKLYASRKIFPDYMSLKGLMEDATTSESKIRIFTDDVLGRFPPLLHLWFINQFPSPSSWFAARLRYTRSCAVMSMVGTILGLGDRHGENVNLEEGNGGVFHVDFNCLFDKGLTFAKPERVPFRLTHNMVAAMGIYGTEGPFRKSSELTLSILRQQEETLMTILESFIYDPTLDLQKDKRAAKRGDTRIKLQPQSVVDSIKRKVKGLLPNESIPLGVEGQVEELIKQAVDPRNLTAMYIGWCPFL